MVVQIAGQVAGRVGVAAGRLAVAGTRTAIKNAQKGAQAAARAAKSGVQVANKASGLGRSATSEVRGIASNLREIKRNLVPSEKDKVLQSNPLMKRLRRVIRRRREKQQNTASQSSASFTPMFWFLFGFNLFVDILDVGEKVLELVGIGTVVGIAISVLLYLLVTFFDVILSAVNATYFWASGTGAMRGIAGMIIAFVIERIPLVNFLPTYAITFLLIGLLARWAGSKAGTSILGRLPIAKLAGI